MRKTGSVRLAGHALTLVLFAAGTRFAIQRGGLGSAPLIALGALPLVATFLGGARAGMSWTAVVLAEVAVFAWLRVEGLLNVDAAGQHPLYLELSGAALFPLLILAIALAYEWSREAALHAKSDSDRERVRAEQETNILRADRMAAVGQLAAGVAHEANNPLGYVTANLAFAEERLNDLGRGDGPDPVREEIREALAEARQGATRIARVVQDLKAYSQKPATESLDPVAVPQALEAALKMVRTELRHRAQVVRSYSEVPLVLADETRLTQVFLNLLLNAAQALPEGRAQEHQVEVRVSAALPSSVQIEIADTGSGIAPEHLERVTEPFFTTKPPDVGTGLGLAVVSSIVRSLQGELTIDSSLGRGTTVRVTLPAAPADSPRSLPTATVRPTPSARLRLLAIDDDRLGLRALQRMLRDHDLTTVDNGREAIALLAAGEHYDVILCDVMMPDLTGVDVHDQIAVLHPHMARRLVFLTGGVSMGATADRLALLPNQRLDKPVDPTALDAALQRVARANSSGTRTKVRPGHASEEPHRGSGS